MGGRVWAISERDFLVQYILENYTYLTSVVDQKKSFKKNVDNKLKELACSINALGASLNLWE